ncbi:MAG: efflux RND transporter periplasmic adaptor subunit [Saprospiraceae bacterium]|nr:efflux RND transporter periplasmic adaptor subunit [Saprospiraceae bacterium]
MSRSIKIIIWVLILAGLAGLMVWKLKSNKEKIIAQAEIAQQTNTDIPVTTVTVSNQTLNKNFDANGSFLPFKQVAVISDVQGKITSLSVNNGDFVPEGKVILTVDSELLQNELNITQKNLKKAENDLSRLNNLLGDGGITQQQIDDASLQIEILKSKIISIEKQLRNTSIKAPISGTVSGKRIEKGSYLAPGSIILDLVNIQKLKMTVTLTEEQVVHVKKGQKIRISADLNPNKSYYGIITFVDIKADASRRYPVEIEITNDNQLKANMSGKAYFDIGGNISALAIPRDCIVGSLRDAKVYVVEGNVAKLREIKAGDIFGEQVQILGGLKAGEVIVKSGQINLQDGSKIIMN